MIVMSSPRTKSIFINCPYDNAYVPTLRPVLFTVRFLGFTPRLAMESSDSGGARINKIQKLIKGSRYAIHDLSRLHAERKGEPFRLNMPFELGLDIGCRVFGGREQKRKRCLILERFRYSVQKALSDLSNSDVCAHEGKPEKAVLHVRNWLVQEAHVTAPSPKTIWYAFNDFVADLDTKLKVQRFSKTDIITMPLNELLQHMTRWINGHQSVYG